MKLKVMSFNLRYGTANDGENSWEHRKTLVIDRIRTFSPDLLGVQECQDNFQAAFLKENLPELGFIGVPRGGAGFVPAHVKLEMTAILFRKSMFEAVDNGTFWLSKTPDQVGSQSWGSMFPRTATWVKLRTRQDPVKEMFFFNTHFDHFSQKAIRESAKLLSDRIQQAASGFPVVLTGDFNTAKGSPAFAILTDFRLRDAHRILADTGLVDEGTFHGFGKIPAQPIDWILISSEYKVLAAGIDRFQNGQSFPSDHWPVTALLEF